MIELENYKEYDKQRTENDIEEVVVQTIPLDEDGEFTMEIEEISALHENARAAFSGSNRKVLTTPAKVETLDFKSRIGQTQDDVEKATKNDIQLRISPMVLFCFWSRRQQRWIRKICADRRSYYV